MDYETINRATWDERAPLHAASREYKVQDYIANPKYIGDVVQFDRPLLGDITGLDCVHLQCHIGTDTLCLARLGAQSVTGLDFSPASLAEARQLAEATSGSGGEKLRFVQASVYAGLEALAPGSFDLVFTGIGSLCWIHSVAAWARVVAGLLKPGGQLFIREGHPMMWAIDDERPGELRVEHPYFERDEPTVFEGTETYVNTGGRQLTAAKSAEFNHGMGEIVQALLQAGMHISSLVEHQSVPWNAFPGQMVRGDDGEYSLRDRP